MKTFRSTNGKTELVRVVHSHDDHTTCDGCAREQNTNGAARTMYRYGEWPLDRLGGEYDAIVWHAGVFCSKSCHDAHFG